MDPLSYCNKGASEVLNKLDSQVSGLKNEEIGKRFKKYGLNKIDSKDTQVWDILIRQIKFPFTYLLIFATIVSFLLKQYSDSIIILIFLSINIFLGFYQEFQSANTLRTLKKHLVKWVKVIREGAETSIKSEDLVPGDILKLAPGDVVPSDIRIIFNSGVSLDESVLTGESKEIFKIDKVLKDKILSANDAQNLAFAGTTVLSGSCTGIVIATGKDTLFGKISKLTLATSRLSTFEKEIGKISRLILWLVVGTMGLVFLANLLIKGVSDIWDLSLFSIALAVSVVPEALPVVVTFSFSRGARRLAKNKVVVKRLSSVEDLGGIEVLCTDKTGTLTENQMEVKDKISLSNHDPLFAASLGINLKNYDKENPINKALVKDLSESDKENIKVYEKVEELPFDPEKLYSVVVVKKENLFTLILKGAPEAIFKLCNITGTELEKLSSWSKSSGNLGNRVLAVASLETYKYNLKNLSNNFELSGLISFSDPIKSTSYAAIKQAQNLGVKIKILTGDSLEVSRNVASKIGLIEKPDQAISGEGFAKLSLDQKREVLEEVHVFARVLPEQKYEIIKILQEKYEVGYLGDGINDAPALKLANVALAVKGAADIAQEASDIVLLKKDLKVITEGIRQGREIFSNTTKYITATLSANFGNFAAISLASLLIDFLPMLPTQILLVNLLSDFPMIAMATDNVDANEIKGPQKYDLKKIVSLATVLGAVSSFFDFLFFLVFRGFGAVILQTGWFMESILTELVFVFSVRSRRIIFKAARPSFFLLLLAILAGLVTIMLPSINLGQAFFGFASLDLKKLSIIVVIVLTYLFVSEITKLVYFRTWQKKNFQ